MNGPTIDDVIVFARNIFDDDICPSEIVALMEELDDFCDESEDYEERIEKELQGHFNKMAEYYRKERPLAFRDLKKDLKSISKDLNKDNPNWGTRWYWKIFED